MDVTSKLSVFVCFPTVKFSSKSTLPATDNVLAIAVAPSKEVAPATDNVLSKVVLFFKVVTPVTAKEPVSSEFPPTFKLDCKVVSPLAFKVPPIQTFLPIPTPPATIKAPVVVLVD